MDLPIPAKPVDTTLSPFLSKSIVASKRGVLRLADEFEKYVLISCGFLLASVKCRSPSQSLVLGEEEKMEGQRDSTISQVRAQRDEWIASNIARSSVDFQNIISVVFGKIIKIAWSYYNTGDLF